jgi:curved DNA-binding protein CbpA
MTRHFGPYDLSPSATAGYRVRWVTTAATDKRQAGGPTTTLYTVLGISPYSDPDTIRDAYRRLARRFHPDTGGDVHDMAIINRAWAELGDPERRAAYDRRIGIERVVAVTAAPPPPEPASEAPLAARMMSGTGTVLDFGRYEGWTIDQLARQDPDYLLWLARTSIGRPLQAEIEAALGNRR